MTKKTFNPYPVPGAKGRVATKKRFPRRVLTKGSEADPVAVWRDELNAISVSEFATGEERRKAKAWLHFTTTKDGAPFVHEGVWVKFGKTRFEVLSRTRLGELPEEEKCPD